MKQFFSIIVLISTSIVCGFGQRINTEFGKNRIQYHVDFDTWNTYESKNFISYFYGEARNVAQYAILIAEKELSDIEKTLEHKLFDKMEFIIYKDLTDLKQSNLGYDEVFVVRNGYTKILGNKIFVYFNGDHNELRKQIKEGIAQVLYQDMMYGGSLNESVQNSVRLNLPQWYADGITRFAGRGWGLYENDLLKDFFQGSSKKKTFQQVQYKNPSLAGASMWFYIQQKYGAYAISNILYLTRINKNLQSGIDYSLGITTKELYQNWLDYFTEIYKNDQNDFLNEDVFVPVKNKRNLPITQSILSRDGKYLAYVLNEKGKVKVYLQNIKNNERQLLLKYGYRNHLQTTDFNYPLLAFTPSGTDIFVLYEQKDIIKYTQFDLETSKPLFSDVLPNKYQRVYSLDFLNNQELIFSAATRGFVDLYKYRINVKQTAQLTNDYYDDLHPKVVTIKGKKGIVFASNRRDSILRTEHPDSLLPAQQYDLFMYALDTVSDELIRITDTPGDEYAPIVLDSNRIIYLTNKGGVVHRNEATIEKKYKKTVKRIYFVNQKPLDIAPDSILANVDTTLIDSMAIVDIYRWNGVNKLRNVYSRNIVDQHSSTSASLLLEKFYIDGQHQLILRDLHKQTRSNLPLSYWASTPHQDSTNIKQKIVASNTIETITEDDSPEESETPTKEDLKQENSFGFQTDFEDTNDVIVEVITEEDSSPSIREDFNTLNQTEPALAQKETRFKGYRITPYFLKFKIDNVNIKMDNQPLFGGLNSVDNPTNGGFEFIRPGVLFKTDFKDVLEDYHMTLGARFSTALDGTEMFILFDDLKKRIDKQYAVYRKTKTYPATLASGDVYNLKLTEVLGYVKYSYPFSLFSSLRASATFRNDNIVTKSIEQVTLNTTDVNSQRVGLKLEYIFDNTLDVAQNIKNGIRLKASFEYLQSVQIQLSDPFTFKLNNGNISVIGLDARGYQRLGRNAIFAVRFAAFTSIGSEKIGYRLGGVENELLPNFNTNPFELEDPSIAYNTQVPQLRGFSTNIRNGHSVALINTEVRMPLVKMIFNRKVNADFLNSLQAVAFFDIGTAWKGFNPFREENPNNTYYLTSPTVDAKVIYFRDPIVAGYGVGMRINLFGYFVKIDRAWGIETKVVQAPKWHFSLDYDF